MRRSIAGAAIVCLAAVAVDSTTGQDHPTIPQVTAERVGLPALNRRTAEPAEVRIYLQGDNGKVNRNDRHTGYPKFPRADVKLQEREEAQYHNALDLGSRLTKDSKPQPLPYKAGIYGTVLLAEKGLILVATAGGSVIHYLHGSEVSVKAGQEVTPATVLGKTGNQIRGKAADPESQLPIHLHLQATDKNNKAIDIDRAFVAASVKPPNSTPIKWFKWEWIDVEPNRIDTKKPVVIDGVLKVEDSKRIYYDDSAPKLPDAESKLVGSWAVEKTFGGIVRQEFTLNADKTALKRYFTKEGYDSKYQPGFTWSLDAEWVVLKFKSPDFEAVDRFHTSWLKALSK